MTWHVLSGQVNDLAAGGALDAEAAAADAPAGAGRGGAEPEPNEPPVLP